MLKPVERPEWGARQGSGIAMDYSLAHFTGYRFAIFSYATVRPGGYVDVDWFRLGDDVGRSSPSG